ncbi:MAG: roadblock/LC7 domain-containing protein [Candidatus Lokiarchaeota archaeon]|nr:roadblock/LC7 domain-containing protein [Candidatus Lokiarchaeota archaeon]
MDKKKLEANLSKLMDDIPEIEGLIALDLKGTVIVGQTITEMDKAALAKTALDVFTKARAMGKSTGKGGVQGINISMDKGSACIVGNDSTIIMSMQGTDASTSIALILRSIKACL